MKQQIIDGLNAQALVDNPVFQAVWDELEAEIIEAWKTAESTTEREQQWQKHTAMSSLRQALTQKINQGLTAQHMTKP